MNAARYRAHDVPVRTSLGRAAAEAPKPSEVLRREATAVWRGGRGVMFFPDQLKAMNPQQRAAIEAAARALYGEQGGGGNG
jgi:hypothetical protein